MVVTTSGTAAVELHPAVVEASHAGVPLVAVTADRPPELHGVGAPQTVDQDGLYGPHPGGPFHPASPRRLQVTRGGRWRRAVPIAATSAPAERAPSTSISPFGSRSRISSLRSTRAPRRRAVAPGGPAAGAAVGRDLVELSSPEPVPGASSWQGVERPEARPMPRSSLPRPAAWAGRYSPTLGPVSGYQPSQSSPLPTPCCAALPAAWRPERCCGSVTRGLPRSSRSGLASSVRTFCRCWSDPWARWADPDRQVAVVTPASGPDIAAAVIDRLENPAAPSEWAQSEWAQSWSTAERAAQDAFARELGPSGPLAMSEPGVARAVVARGSRWRSARCVFLDADPRRRVVRRPRLGPGGARQPGRQRDRRGRLHRDRGRARHQPGRWSRCSGTWLSSRRRRAPRRRDRPVELTLVVVDNDGGGIFSFLPQATALPADQFERYWGTPHGVDVSWAGGGIRCHVVEAADPASRPRASPRRASRACASSECGRTGRPT